MMIGIANTTPAINAIWIYSPNASPGCVYMSFAPTGSARRVGPRTKATMRSIRMKPTSAPPAMARSARTIRFRKASRCSRIEMFPKSPSSRPHNWSVAGVMGPLRELLAIDPRQALEFFVVRLQDVSEPAVDRQELLYNASLPDDGHGGCTVPAADGILRGPDASAAQH